MNRLFCISLSLLFVFGALFPLKSSKLFRCTGDKGLADQIKKVFHATPDMERDVNSKKYPKKFDDMLEKELRYPVK